MALLVGTGLGMAALSGASAFWMAYLLSAVHNQTRLAAVMGLLASHVHDLGRVAEYRQTLKRGKKEDQPGDPAEFTVRISGLRLKDNRPVPDLLAMPGGVAIIASDHPEELVPRT